MKKIIVLTIIFCVIMASWKLNNSENFNISVKNVDGFHFLYYEFTGPYDKAYLTFNELIKYMQDNKVEMGKNSVGLYFDDPQQVAPEKLKSEVGHIITKKVEPKGKFKYKKIENFKAVHARYESAEQIKAVYQAMGKYISDNKLVTSGSSIEIYSENDPMKADVYMPVK